MCGDGAGGNMGGRVSVLSCLRDVDGQAQVGSAELHCVTTLLHLHGPD